MVLVSAVLLESACSSRLPEDGAADSGGPVTDAAADSGGPVIDGAADSGGPVIDAAVDSGGPVIDAAADSGGPVTCPVTCALPTADLPPIPRSAIEGQCDVDAGDRPFPAICGPNYWQFQCLPSDCVYKNGGAGLNAGPIVCCSQPH